jgi:hypothetical protein
LEPPGAFKRRGQHTSTQLYILPHLDVLLGVGVAVAERALALRRDVADVQVDPFETRLLKPGTVFL